MLSGARTPSQLGGQSRCFLGCPESVGTGPKPQGHKGPPRGLFTSSQLGLFPHHEHPLAAGALPRERVRSLTLIYRVAGSRHLWPSNIRATGAIFNGRSDFVNQPSV
jgi:hypothetical protein